jgi:hypothetical protein
MAKGMPRKSRETGGRDEAKRGFSKSLWLTSEGCVTFHIHSTDYLIMSVGKIVEKLASYQLCPPVPHPFLGHPPPHQMRRSFREVDWLASISTRSKVHRRQEWNDSRGRNDEGEKNARRQTSLADVAPAVDEDRGIGIWTGDYATPREGWGSTSVPRRKSKRSLTRRRKGERMKKG